MSKGAIKHYLMALAVFLLLDGLWIGLVTYAAYDLTNLATIDRWPLLVTVVDLAWGAVLSGMASFVVVWFMRKKA